MGISTDATLFFGVSLGGPEEPEIGVPEFPWDTEEAHEEGLEWTDFVSEKLGVPIPYHLRRLRDFTTEQVRECSGYLSRKREVISSLRCTLRTYCSYSCPMYYVAHIDHIYTAWRGHAEQIQPDKLVTTDRHVGQIREFLEVIGVEDPERWVPCWTLVSLLGK